MDIIETLYELFTDNPSVTTDTRRIKEGDIFFALKGPNFNGNKFAAKAIEMGAAAVVVDEDHGLVNSRLFLVDDSLKALQSLATHHRNTFTIPFIGITGSNGKTTTKELIRDVLATQYKVVATEGNLNNHIGVPLTLLSISKDTEIAIIEMGANHQGEIKNLCEIARPNIGYITNFGKAHLEGFGGVEGVVKGKSELFDFLKTNGGKAFYNADDIKVSAKARALESISFSTIKGDIIIKDETEKENVQLSFQNKKIESHLFGSFNFNNASASIAFGHYFNVSIENIKQAISTYIPSMNRSEFRHTDKNSLLMDAYNANPTSMELSIKEFLKLKDKPLTLILADMFELGKYAKKEHQKIVDLIRESEPSLEVFLIGEEFFRSKSPKTWLKFKSTNECKEYLITNPLVNRYVLLKGSRSMKLESLVSLL